MKESAKTRLIEQKLAEGHGRINELGIDLSSDLLRQGELKELFRQRELKEEQARLVRIISHELRTPLSLIDSGAQIVSLRADQISSDDLRLRMTKVRNAVQRISILLHKLVDLVTIDTEASETQRVPSAISALVTNIATALVPPTQLQLTMPEGLCANALVEDGFAVSFALRTALGNAMLCSDEKSPIKVTAKVDASNAVIEVSNCGQAIPEPEIEQIGEPSLRGLPTMAAGGAGISLHLARELIEDLSGRLTIRTEANETTLSIQIPVMAQFVQPAEDKGGESIL